MKNPINASGRNKYYMVIHSALIMLGIFFSSNAIAQNTSLSPMQAGTLTIKNGQATVAIEKSLSDKLNTPGSGYYVTLSPLLGFVPAYISKKDNNTFNVAVGTDAQAKFEGAQIEYIVFYTDQITSSSTDARTENNNGEKKFFLITDKINEKPLRTVAMDHQ